MDENPVILTLAGLDSEPIEREELEDGTVRYNNIKLLDTGVWTDENSRTPTLYDERTFENTEPNWNEEKYDGPPVNIHHDLDERGNPNEASVGGYIDPDSLRTDGNALFGDFVFDRNDDAGAFADTNLQSSIESGGQVGFSPSVELSPKRGEVVDTPDNPRAEQHVQAAELTGTGLVRDPASKTVDFAHETRNRAVVMGAEGQTHYTLESGDTGMDEDLNLEELREKHNLSDDVDAETVKELAEAGLLSLKYEDKEKEEEDEEEEESEMEESDEEEEEEEAEMAEDMDPQELVSMVQALRERLETLEEEHEALMSAEEVTEELAEAKQELSSEVKETAQELAEAETVQELQEAKEDLDKRLSKIEEQPEKPRTMAEGEANTRDSEPKGRITTVSDPSPY